IVRRHVDGTRYGIRVDAADGLLTQGADGLALTWMDARVDGVPVTQRAGKPVEVNALWLRALDVVPGFESLRDTAASSFVRRFDRGAGAGLSDVVDGPRGDDAAIRPNQRLAVALPTGPLGPQAARAAVETCRRSLLTPLGLRSLAPEDPRYRPYHRGAPADR